jgi:hypothetical protein
VVEQGILGLLLRSLIAAHMDDAGKVVKQGILGKLKMMSSGWEECMTKVVNEMLSWIKK